MLEVYYIECQKGWQAEIIINATWTAYTHCLGTKEGCKAQVEKFAKAHGDSDYIECGEDGSSE